MNLQQSTTSAVEQLGARKDAEIHLQGVWLVIARIAWVAISLLAVGLFVASLPSYFSYLHIPATYSYEAPQLTPNDIHALQLLGLSLDFYAWLNMSVSVIILLVYVLVGIVLFLRKSDDHLALLASISLVLFPLDNLNLLPTYWHSYMSHRLAGLPLPARVNSHSASADQVGHRWLRYRHWNLCDFANY